MITGIVMWPLLNQCKIHPAFLIMGSMVSVTTIILLFRVPIKTAGIIIFFSFLIFGMVLNNLESIYLELPENSRAYKSIVLNPAVEKTNSYQIDCIIHAPCQMNKKIKQNVRLYFPKDSSLLGVQTGDSLIFTASLSKIKNRGNPKEFDYARYMNISGFRYSGYVSDGNYSPGGYSGKIPVRRLASKVQKRLIDQFTMHGIRGDELAVLSALTTGNRTLIDDELRTNYSQAGAMHILAVSGLHVGILYLILSFIITARINNTLYRIMRFVIILASIWLYAFITGLTPSVMRASIMFSLFLMATQLHRNTSAINILAASALIILIIHPYELFKPGFQFSYLAVLGILLFQPKLNAILPQSRWLVLNWLWQLLTVSISAQIFTFPLALYYFHQFPVYFLLTNIFIIPLVWLIIVFTLLMSLFGNVFLFAQILNKLLAINNLIIEHISKLPGACINHIPFNTIMLTLTFLLLLSVTYMVGRKQYKAIVYPALLYLISMIGIQIFNYQLYSSKKELIIYNSGKHLLVSLLNGHQHILITRSTDSAYYDQINYLEPFFISRGILKHTTLIETSKLKGTYKVDNQLQLICNGSNLAIQYLGYTLKTVPSHFKNWDINMKERCYFIVDCLSGYPTKNTRLQPCKNLVITSGANKYKARQWQLFAQHFNCRVYDIETDGAFRINISEEHTYNSLVSYLLK